MKNSLQKAGPTRERIGDRALSDGLKKVLEKRYGRIRRSAGAEWDRRFAGGDPSDACVSVRISAWSRTLSEVSLS